MKKLEELGISPAPWKCATNDWKEVIGIESKRGFYVARFAIEVEPEDARIMESAPKLYDALYDVVAYCESVHLVPSERFSKVLEKAKAALAEAAGEEAAKA